MTTKILYNIYFLIILEVFCGLCNDPIVLPSNCLFTNNCLKSEMCVCVLNILTNDEDQLLL